MSQPHPRHVEGSLLSGWLDVKAKSFTGFFRRKAQYFFPLSSWSYGALDRAGCRMLPALGRFS